MELNEQLVESLNDLVKINYDRLNTYRKIRYDLEENDGDLRAICDRIVRQTELYGTELESIINEIGCTYNNVHGKAYRIWLKLKGIFMEKDRVSILNFMDFNEEAAEKAYEYIINEVVIPKEIKSILTRQQLSLKTMHDIIKQINDNEIIQEPLCMYAYA